MYSPLSYFQVQHRKKPFCNAGRIEIDGFKGDFGRSKAIGFVKRLFEYV
jgi:hypothetical protein